MKRVLAWLEKAGAPPWLIIIMRPELVEGAGETRGETTDRTQSLGKCKQSPVVLAIARDNYESLSTRVPQSLLASPWTMQVRLLTSCAHSPF
ncbi:unnamed protein product [Strongylus vulgaris]|uniref:Uncharacterized protein n=1 Tax=Strongylus vulgaris TaxID=40348 RepID=A0A3P7JVM4_STRVU|nr:unnamed protein product [Strongylus vulgaris]